MTATIAADALAIGSDERIALAKAIAGLIGKMAGLSIVQRTTELVPCVNHLVLTRPGTFRMTSSGVVLEIHESCHRLQREGWTEVRPLATPFGNWRICPGIHNGGGDTFMRQADLDRLLEECSATDLPRTDALNYPGPQEFTHFKTLRRVGSVELPDAVGVKDEFDIPGYQTQHFKALRREWEKQIAPNLPAWYDQP